MKLKWPWTKQKPMRIYDVPEKQMKKFCILLDNAKNKHGKYLFWSFICELFPQVKDGEWHYHMSSCITAQIREGLSEDWD
jgi:hypothetical protein